MIESRGYRRFVSLMERIESHGSRRQPQTLCFRRLGGGVAGVITLHGGLVRFGACCEEQEPVDEQLRRDAPQLADALVQGGRGPHSAAMPALKPQFPAPLYAALCGLTARTLRRIAEVYDPGALADRQSNTDEPHPYLADIGFTPSELMLAAGRHGGIARDDLSVRLYGTPPGRAEERWLFERQPGEHGVPWPIMTTRLHGRGVSPIAAYGTLVQLLTAAAPSRRGSSSHPHVAIIRFEQQLCLLHSTERYVTLLVYPAAHAKRVLSAFEALSTRAGSAEQPSRSPAETPDGSEEAEGMLASASPHSPLPGPPLPVDPDPLSAPPLSLPEAATSDAPVLWEESDPSSPAVLSLRGFQVHLGGRCILRDLSLDIAATGVYLLVSPEGGAKRLLVRALCGPCPSTMRCSGSARYLGRPLLLGSGPAAPQSGAALLMMSVCDYLISNLPDRDLLLRPAQRRAARALLDQVRLPSLVERFDDSLLQLDASERRALEIVRTAASRPALLVIDEPLAGVPPPARPPLIELLRVQATERAVLLLAQDADPLLELGPKTAWLGLGTDPTQGDDWPEHAAAAPSGAEPR